MELLHARENSSSAICANKGDPVQNRSITDADFHSDSYLFTCTVCSNENRNLASYSYIRKEKSEIKNFVSMNLRILRSVKGVCDWMVDGKILQIAPGDVMILNNACKRNIHKIYSSETEYEMFAFYPYVFSKNQLWTVFFTSQHKIPYSDSDRCNTIQTLLDMLREEMIASADKPYHVESITHTLNLLAIAFSREIGLHNTQGDSSLHQIFESLNYMSEHFCERISLEEMASRFSYTPEHFSRIFKRYIGISPFQYLINFRLDHAVQLMQHEQITVLDAAYRSGFQNASAFYKAFKKYRGTTPTQYMKSIASQMNIEA